MWLFIFWPINILGCITLIAGSAKFGNFLSEKYFNGNEAITIVSSLIGIFLAYRLSKYTHIWGEKHMTDIENPDPITTIIDKFGLSFAVPILFIYLMVWIFS